MGRRYTLLPYFYAFIITQKSPEKGLCRKNFLQKQEIATGLMELCVEVERIVNIKLIFILNYTVSFKGGQYKDEYKA